MATFPTAEPRYTPPLDTTGILLAEELCEIAERAQTYTSATGVMIALRRSNELVVRTSSGIAPEVGACIPMPSGVTGLCITTRKPQTCASADAEAQLEAVFRAIGVRSVLSVPVSWDGEVRGVLAVLAQMPEAFSRTHIAILMTLRDVIANKLSQCALPIESPRQLEPAQAVELDAETLLQAPAPAPTAVAPPSPAPAPAKASEVPTPRVAPFVPQKLPVAIFSPPPAATPVAKAATRVVPQAATPLPARVEPVAATPVVHEEPKLPVATPLPSPQVVKPLAELFKPAEAPAKMDPDVICPGDDPSKYGSVVVKPKPVLVPQIHAAAAVGASPTMFTAYHAPAKSSPKNLLVFAGAAAAVVVLGLAIALYPRHKAADAPASASVVAQETPAAAAVPSLIAVPLPKSAGEHAPLTAASNSAAPSTIAKREETRQAAEEPKRTVEASGQKSAPVLQLASGKPVAKAMEEPVEAPPALALTGGPSVALPVLPAAPRAAALAVRESALVPATLLQGRSPQYPEQARRMGISGVVKLHVSIAADGKVIDVTAVAGEPLLRQASITAVRNWVYRPAYLDGTPVASTADISLRFNAPK